MPASHDDPLHLASLYDMPAPSRFGESPPPIEAEIVVPRPPRRRSLTPWILFLATCASTFLVQWIPARSVADGLLYAGPLMLILTAHELGHYFQAQWYRVPVTLPYFIPFPSYFGTMGAVIGMKPNVGDRKALFDIGITGPLAGLVPTLVFSAVGLRLSTVIDVQATGAAGGVHLGTPLLFDFLTALVIGPIAPGKEVLLHPMAYAGWVCMFITALNLIPIGQLDGGHILYGLLRRRAHPIAVGLLFAAAAAVAITGTWSWTLMILLVALIGPKHPPTADDHVPLGTLRIVLGWLALLFVVIGFTPTPFIFPSG